MLLACFVRVVRSLWCGCWWFDGSRGGVGLGWRVWLLRSSLLDFLQQVGLGEGVFVWVFLDHWCWVVVLV